MEARNPDEIAVSICGFVADLLSHIEDLSSFTSWIQKDEIATSLEKSLSALALKLPSTTVRSRNLLDSSATALWNAFNRLLQITDELEFTPVFIQVPLLAYHMLVSCVAHDEETFSHDSRYLMVLIRCVEICLAGDMTEKASNMLQQAASAINTLQSSGPIDKEFEISTAKYHILRATVALKDRNIESIETELSQVSENSMKVDPRIGEQYVILCHTALRQALESAEAADKWLIRISDAFRIFHEYSSLYSDCQKVYLEVIYTLAADVIAASEACETLGMQIFKTINLDYVKDPLVLVLQLEFMSKQRTQHLQTFHEALTKYIDLMEPSILNFKRSLKYVSRLRSLGSDSTLETIEHLFERIGAFPRDEYWLERTFFALIRLLTSASWKSLGCLKTLENVTNILSEILPQSLSNEASDASLIIIWKEAVYFSLQGDFLEALHWYRLSQHILFHRASEVNQMKILKKLIFCGFRLGDAGEVKRAWTSLPEQERDPQSTYLVYQVLLKDSDSSLAAEVLRSLADLGKEGYMYISAAIAAVSLSQGRRQALESIQYFTEKTPDGDERRNLNLYRIAVQLIVLEIRERDNPVLHGQLGQFLSRAVDAFQCQDFELNDLDWFSRCSYLASLELFDKIDGHQALSLLNVSLKLMNIYPRKIGSDVKLDLLRRRVSCHYIHVLINTAIARKETDFSKKELSYSQVRKHFQEIQKLVPESRRSSRDIISHEEYRQMLLFKTEATGYLQQWGQGSSSSEH